MWSFVCPTSKRLEEGKIASLVWLEDDASRNNSTNRLVKKGELVLDKLNLDKVYNILCSQNVTCQDIWRLLEIGSQ